MGKKLNKMYRESLNIIDSADAIMIFLFGLIDIIFLIFCFIKFFKTLNIKIRLLKYNLYWLLIVDDAIKIFYLKKIVILKSAFNRELIYSILTTCQFFLFLSFLEKAFNITKVFRNIKFYETLNQLHLSAIFLFAIFSYEKFIKFGKRIICPMQYIIIIICLYKLYEFLNIKISQIVDNSIKRKIILNKKITFFLLGAPLPSLVLFICYYILKIFFLFINKKKFSFIFEKIILNIIKDTSKLFIFLTLIIILNVLNESQVLKNEAKHKNINNDDEERAVINY